ncbi:MAG: hypothetical protein RR212_04735 [Bacteroidales bacterium]
MRLFQAFLSLFVVLCLVSLLSYGMAPQSDSFHWALLNPMEAISSIMFLLSFGLGFPIGLSIAVIIVIIVAVWYGIYLLLGRLFKNRLNS